MKALVAVLGFSLVCGCTTSAKKESLGAAQAGISVEHAFVIRAQSQSEGLAEEYAILKRTFPDARPAEVEPVGKEEVVFGHRTEARDGRMFSVHTLVLRDGTIRPVYFDITSYFGR
jgi:hypothetical protein